MSKIEPLLPVEKIDIARLEYMAIREGCCKTLRHLQWNLGQMIENLSKEDWMHLELNVDSIIEGLEEMRKVHKHYRKAQRKIPEAKEAEAMSNTEEGE